MAEKKYYSIGEIADLCSISSKTLRYYDAIGLLSPGYKNSDTNYRYYTKDQIFNVFLIRKLQALGFSLKEIQTLLEADDTQAYSNEVPER